MTIERKREIVKEAGSLIKQGKKREGYDMINRLIPMSPMMADDFKRFMGLDFMRECGFNLDDAVEAYGEEWLRS